MHKALAGLHEVGTSGEQSSGALAVQGGTFELQPGAATSSSVAAAAPAERAGKYGLVLTRAGEAWKICRDLWNPDQPAGESPSRAAG
jgi:hypothetical protein